MVYESPKLVDLSEKTKKGHGGDECRDGSAATFCCPGLTAEFTCAQPEP
jgi:hypothetical protein